MKTCLKRNGDGLKPQRLSLRTLLLLFTALAIFNAGTGLCSETDSDTPLSSRELYNEGTKKLQEGKLNEAEDSLQGAVARQDIRVQPVALYNLGLTRFQQGAVALTNVDEGAEDGAASQAKANGNAALSAIDQALAGDDLDAIVAAYQRGRGSRKELKSVLDAVKESLSTYSSVLQKWRRSSGDFRSTVELEPGDPSAQTNANIVDRCIAQLVDRMKMLASRQGSAEQMREDLRKKMQQLRGKLPKDDGRMPGDDGDDDDGDKPPKQPKDGGFEGPPKNGSEMQLTPEEARRLLGMLKLDAERKLFPGGFEDTAKPKDRKGRDW